MILKGIALLIATALTIGILHYKYYRHHWFGLSIICIGLIFFTIHNLFLNWNQLTIEIGNTEGNSPSSILLNIVLSYLWVSFQEVLEKYLMEKMMISPFIVCGLQGVGGVILMLILFPIVFGCKINGLTFEAFCNFFSILGEECIGMIKYYIILLFAFCSFNTLRLMNNFHYYPTRMMPDSTLVKSDSCEAWCHGHPKGLYSYCHSHGLRKCSKNFGEE